MVSTYIFMCCARCRRSESVRLTMPRISSKSDSGRGCSQVTKAPCLVETIRSAIPTAGEGELDNNQAGRELPLALALRLREGLAGGGCFCDQVIIVRGNRFAVFRLRVCNARNDREPFN